MRVHFQDVEELESKEEKTPRPRASNDGQGEFTDKKHTGTSLTGTPPQRSKSVLSSGLKSKLSTSTPQSMSVGADLGVDKRLFPEGNTDLAPFIEARAVRFENPEKQRNEETKGRSHSREASERNDDSARVRQSKERKEHGARSGSPSRGSINDRSARSGSPRAKRGSQVEYRRARSASPHGDRGSTSRGPYSIDHDDRRVRSDSRQFEIDDQAISTGLVPFVFRTGTVMGVTNLLLDEHGHKLLYTARTGMGVLSLNTGRSLGSLPQTGHSQDITSIDTNERIFATGSADRTARFFSWETMDCTRVTSRRHGSSTTLLIFFFAFIYFFCPLFQINTD